MHPCRNMLPPCKTSPELKDEDFPDFAKENVLGRAAAMASIARRNMTRKSGKLSSSSRARLFRVHQGNIDQVLAQEPHLQFIGAQNVADDQVIRAVIAYFGSAAR